MMALRLIDRVRHYESLLNKANENMLKDDEGKLEMSGIGGERLYIPRVWFLAPAYMQLPPYTFMVPG